MIDLIKTRRDLHQIPELGFKEYNTQRYIVNALSKMNCKLFLINTGVVAFFNNGKEKTLAYRSDMDGLAIKEENEVEYKSKNDCMHACGHDAHMALALGICDYLNDHYHEYPHNFAIIFQPSEEVFGGSKLILDSNILSELKVDKIIGIHLFPKLEKGKFLTSKTIFASSREIDISIKTSPIHAANKKEGKDSLKIAINIINYINKLKYKSSLIHIGYLSSGISRNIVSPVSTIKGTIRSKKEDKKICDKIINKIKKIQKRNQIEISYNLSSYLPMINNDANLINRAKEKIPLVISNHTYYQGEDFSLYSQKYHSLFLLYGIGDTPYLHSSNFNFDDSLLKECLSKLIKLLSIV